MNTYDIIKGMRISLNEYSDSLMDGTEAGFWDNWELLRAANQAQRQIAHELKRVSPTFFRTSASLIGSNSVYTLPDDCLQCERFEDSNRVSYSLIGLGDRTTARQTQFYIQGRTLVLDKTSVSDTMTLWYYRRLPDLDFGVASDGGAQSITLASTARRVADYYNDCGIEVVSGTGSTTGLDEITDYTAARVATVSGTYANDSVYGTISQLPEDFYDLIGVLGALIARTSKANDVSLPTDGDWSAYGGLLVKCLEPYNIIIEEEHEDLYQGPYPMVG